MKKTIIYLLFFFSIFLLFNNCSKFKPVDAKNNPTNALERARKNVNEGRGVSLGNILGGNKNTNFEFSTSNPLWRASLEILDFLPLTVVDYAGGMIISDWYGNDPKENIKITLRFLSNEIRADSIKIIVHQRKCSINNSCKTEVINSKIRTELLSSIIKKAAIIQKETKIK